MQRDSPVWKIYALKDPRCAAVRYIGCTVTDLADRLSSHISQGRRGRLPVHRWIQELLAENLLPQIEVLDTATRISGVAERWWIEHYRANGADLTNLSGGAGGLSRGIRERTAETRRRISQASKNRSEEHKERLAATRRGKPVSEETRARMSAGRLGMKLSAEHKTHIGRALKGRPLSPEHRAKLSAANKGQKPYAIGAAHPTAKLTDDAVRDIRYLHKRGVTIKALANTFHVSKSAIDHVLQRITWKHIE